MFLDTCANVGWPGRLQGERAAREFRPSTLSIAPAQPPAVARGRREVEMEGTAVLSYVAKAVAGSEFMLVDIGCSGGIDPVWCRFGRRLRAVAIDPNLVEIDRLRGIESNSGVEYVAAFAGVPPEHPFAIRKGDRSNWGCNPWDRLSVARSLQILKARELSNAEKTAANLWPEMELADAVQAIVVPD